MKDTHKGNLKGTAAHRNAASARHDEDLREPLVRFQGSHVSMHMARRSASLFSSHGRGLGPQDALKKDSRCLSRLDLHIFELLVLSKLSSSMPSEMAPSPRHSAQGSRSGSWSSVFLFTLV